MEESEHRRRRRRVETPSSQAQRLGPLIVAVVILLGIVLVGGRMAWTRFVDPVVVEKTSDSDAGAKRNEDGKPEVERLVSALTLEQKVAQLFVVRPESLVDVKTVVKAGAAMREALTNYPVGGLYYTSANLMSVTQTKEMLRNSQNYTKDACGLPLFTCVMEEGGSMVQVGAKEDFGVAKVEDMSKIGASDDAEQARAAASAIGGYLVDLGFNVNLAPVADLVSSSTSDLAKRSFGENKDTVASMVSAQVEGYTRAGVLCAVKHFPGMGNAEKDSRVKDLLSIQATKDEMMQGQLVPFEAAIHEGVPIVMVGNVCCQNLEGSIGHPASIDSAVMEGLLRGELGYDGVIMTDTFESDAITKSCKDGEQGVLAIKAGADLVFLPHDFAKAYRGLLDAVKKGEISEERIDESLYRIAKAKLRYVVQ